MERKISRFNVFFGNKGRVEINLCFIFIFIFLNNKKQK